MIRIDVQSNEDEYDRACLIVDAATAQRVIADLQRAVYEAMRMES